MINPEPGCLYWLVHLKSMSPTALRFIRTSRGGAYVVGGKSGSHFTGRGESYWDKFKEIINLGFIPVEVARDLKLLSSDCTPPAISSNDKEILEKIERCLSKQKRCAASVKIAVSRKGCTNFEFIWAAVHAHDGPAPRSPRAMMPWSDPAGWLTNDVIIATPCSHLYCEVPR